MADPFQNGDELKNKYINDALHANDEAASASKFSDLFDKDSHVYKNDDALEKQIEKAKEKIEAPIRPTTDAEGFPIIDPVHTYKEDLAGIINKDKISLERIAMMQSDANRANAPLPEKPEERKGRALLVSAIAMFALGAIVIIFVYILNVSRNAPAPTPIPKERYIIFTESSQEMNIENATKTEIGGAILGIASKFKYQDSVKQIIPKMGDTGSTNATLSDLFQKTNQRVPDDLLRSLYSKFFLGLYSKNGKTDPFLLFYTNSYDIAYPGLLDWEGFMQDDLNWLFDTRPVVGATTLKLSFKDRVIGNVDARSFEDESGRTAFFYLFLDQNTILFARNADTVRMVQDRLRQAKFQ